MYAASLGSFWILWVDVAYVKAPFHLDFPAGCFIFFFLSWSSEGVSKEFLFAGVFLLITSYILESTNLVLFGFHACPIFLYSCTSLFG